MEFTSLHGLALEPVSKRGWTLNLELSCGHSCVPPNTWLTNCILGFPPVEGRVAYLCLWLGVLIDELGELAGEREGGGVLASLIRLLPR